jgi:2-dehydropantoate 2-reductase
MVRAARSVSSSTSPSVSLLWIGRSFAISSSSRNHNRTNAMVQQHRSERPSSSSIVSSSSSFTNTKDHMNDDDTKIVAAVPNCIYILGAGSIGLFIASSVRCTFPAYPIKLLLRESSSLLSTGTIHTNNTANVVLNNTPTKKKYINVSLQQTFPKSQLPSSSSSSSSCTIGRRITANSSKHTTSPRRYSPRVVPVPYEIIPSLQLNNTKKERILSYIVVTTKAHQALDAIASIQHRIDKSTSILLLCNGALAVADRIRQHLVAMHHHSSNMDPNQHNHSSPSLDSMPKIYYAYTTHGVYREKTTPITTTTNSVQTMNVVVDDDDDDMDMCTVVHAGYGEIVIHGCEEIANVLQSCGLNCSSLPASEPEQMEFLLWKKLAANCVINPITAIYQCTNGAVYHHVPRFQQYYLPGIIKEVARVYVAVTSVKPQPRTSSSPPPTAPPLMRTTILDDTTPVVSTTIHSVDQNNKNHQHQVPETDAVDQVYTIMYDYVVQVIESTKNNRSSSFQDVLNVQPPLEMHYLNGFIIQQAKLWNLPCPINTELYNTLFPPPA